MSSDSDQFCLSFQISPIVFCGGIAQNMPGGVMPIISITEAARFAQGITGFSGPIDLSDYFANFIPPPASTLGENQIGEYPLANQVVAANALIAQPLIVSAVMICPVRKNGWSQKNAIMASLTAAMAQHDSLGGTYTYVTPAFFYTDLVRLRMVDVSTTLSKQPQEAYQIDFRKPLLTLAAAQQAQNTLMTKLSNGTQITGQPSYSGSAASVGQPSSLVGTSLPSGGSTAGTNTAPLPLPPPATPQQSFGAELT
jgi:hypothetical protein